MPDERGKAPLSLAQIRARVRDAIKLAPPPNDAIMTPGEAASGIWSGHEEKRAMIASMARYLEALDSRVSDIVEEMSGTPIFPEHVYDEMLTAIGVEIDLVADLIAEFMRGGKS